MRIAYITLVVLPLLAGCGTFQAITDKMDPPAPATPAIADIQAQATAIGAYKGTPADFLALGEQISDLWCSNYLNALARNAAITDFEGASVSQMGQLGSGIAGAVGSAAAIPAVIGILFPAISQGLVSSGKMATAGMDPGSVTAIVDKGQDTMKSAFKTTPPVSLTESLDDVTQYARVCQPAEIRRAVLQAIVSATATAK